MTNNKDIKILMVDDHMVVRKGLGLVLNDAPGISVVGEADSGEEALYLARKLNPDIILMDVKMSGVGGTETTKLISQHHDKVKVLALSTFANQEIVSGMFDAGACGYLLKDVSADDLVAAIWRIHKDERVMPGDYSELPEQTDSETVTTVDDDDIADLGDQQKRVLALMTKGLTNPEIADQVGISNSTVRYHVSAILRKLDVSNRSEATALAVRMNLVCAEDF